MSRSDLDAIVSTTRSYRARPLPPGVDPSQHSASAVPGELLVMASGQRWFHPLSGAAPWRLEGEEG